MAELIYALCALTSMACAYLLLRAYRRSKSRILLWSGLCFVGLSFNNILLALDKVVFLSVDLSTWRQVTALVALLALLYGLIFDDE
jgi:hypothetical protein